MKKTLKLLVIASLMVMSVPFVTLANEDEGAVEEGFIPYSPAPPQDWTQDQWRQWGLALEMCLIPALDRAQELVADARAVLAEAGVTAESLPQKTEDVMLFASIVPSVLVTSAANIDLTPAQIASLQALINEYEDLYERIQNFLYEFENTEMDFDVAITRIYELCDELLLLNTGLEGALKGIGNDPGSSGNNQGSSGGNQGSSGGNQGSSGGNQGSSGGNQGSSGGNQAGPPIVKDPERPGGGSPETPGGGSSQAPDDQRPTLPQTGTAIAITGIGSGIALAAVGAGTAYLKKKKNS